MRYTIVFGPQDLVSSARVTVTVEAGDDVLAIEAAFKEVGIVPEIASQVIVDNDRWRARYRLTSTGWRLSGDPVGKGREPR